MLSPRRLRHLASAFLLFLPLLVFFRPLFTGQAFLPGDLLSLVSPYKATGSYSSPWNVLRFDGITQFYPWRLETARQINEGRIPFWNEYAFAAEGGTPLLANSQSAPFYPPNLVIFSLMYRLGVFWYAFGLSAALHLLLAIKGMYLLLRAFGRSRPASLMGAVTFGLSGPIITWLSLPTFLCVTAWLPWLLLCIHRACERKSLGYTLTAGCIVGMTLLAGHLQIAFYVLMTGGIYFLWRGHFDVRGKRLPFTLWAGGAAIALIIGAALAAPQVVPALQLSRISARALAGPATMEGYQAYVSNALPLRNLVTLLIPDFFGHPNRNGGFYWNTNNYAEWCYYVGILPAMLAVFALVMPWRIPTSSPQDEYRERGFFAIVLFVSLLLAFGTWLNLPFFFLIPGYSQTGNPGRCLFVVAFSLAALAGYGIDILRLGDRDAASKRRAAFASILIPVFLTAIGTSLAISFARVVVPQAPVSGLLQIATPDAIRGIVLLVLAAIAFAALRRAKPERQSLVATMAIALTILDLWSWGQDYNPTSPPSSIYPVTPGIAFLQQNGKNALIAPLNQFWSNGNQPPRDAVLPPNALTVYQLHDIAGYDSLFPAQRKESAKKANNGEDPSPPENGNIVFTKSIEAAKAQRARYMIAPPDSPDLSLNGLRTVYSGADMTIYENPDGKDFHR